MIRGTALKDKKTKHLIPRLQPGDIAVILHRDLDEIAALQLLEKKIRACINGEPFISGRYPNVGPRILSNAGVLLIDAVGLEAFEAIQDGKLAEIQDGSIMQQGRRICSATILSMGEINQRMEAAAVNAPDVLQDFIQNTLEYAAREKDLILAPITMPPVKARIQGRHCLVVTRGKNYKADLSAILPYLREVRPIIIGVDGGGDALLEYGIRPDILVGDMDSVSDHCLQSCSEIILHGYTDGRCPAMARIRKLGLDAAVFPYPGTSEDIALLLAYEGKAELIVTVGSHTSMMDFLEKGRGGMASTFLVRMKVGDRIIDAKGVHELYKNRIRPGYLAALIVSALFPLALIARLSPQLLELYRLLFLRLRILIGW